MYEFVETWNPLAGACFHGCKYCSTNNLKKRFPNMVTKYSGEPRLCENAMKENLYSKKYKGKTIFVCGQNDLFAQDINRKIVSRIMERCNKFPENTYFFQTKNPLMFRFDGDLLPKNIILCVTLESNRQYVEMAKSPLIKNRVKQLNYIAGFGEIPIQITIEPIMDFDLKEFVEMIESCYPEQVNLGCDSKQNNLPEPGKEKVLQLITELEKFTKVHIKSNLSRIIN